MTLRVDTSACNTCGRPVRADALAAEGLCALDPRCPECRQPVPGAGAAVQAGLSAVGQLLGLLALTLGAAAATAVAGLPKTRALAVGGGAFFLVLALWQPPWFFDPGTLTGWQRRAASLFVAAVYLAVGAAFAWLSWTAAPS